jgi:hypothetical protein
MKALQETERSAAKATAYFDFIILVLVMFLFALEEEGQRRQGVRRRLLRVEIDDGGGGS